MKIIRIITRLNIGGPAIHAKILHEGLSGNGIESILVHGRVSRAEGDMSYLFSGVGGQIIEIQDLRKEISLIHDLRALCKICLLMLKVRPDVVHTHMSKAGTLARIGAILLRLMGIKIRLVHTFHGHLFEGYFSHRMTRAVLWIERFLGKRTDALIALTESQKEDLCSYYRIAPCKKFRVIRLGFELRPFLGLKGKGDGRTVIGIVGRLVPIKNHELFLKTARLLSLERKDVEFCIIGDGEKREALNALAKRLGIQGRVHFEGWVTDMTKAYSKMDVLVMTSLNEGTPVSIIEAMAGLVPVVSTDVGGIRDILGEMEGWVVEGKVSSRKRGVLCHTFDPNDLLEAVRFVLDLPQTKKNLMLHEAREYVRKNFHKDRLINEMLKLYNTLIGE